MMMFLLLFLIFIILSFIMILMNFLISKKKFKIREKNSSFECGFDPISNTRMPFSVQFFLISLIFLIFDIEITLLIPLIYSIIKFNFWMIFVSILFIIILIISLYFEIIENMIEWKF